MFLPIRRGTALPRLRDERQLWAGRTKRGSKGTKQALSAISVFNRALNPPVIGLKQGGKPT